MHSTDVLAYVQSAAKLLDLPLEAARAASVASQLERTWLLAQQLEAFPLPPEQEMSELFCPAAFPADFPAPQGDGQGAP